MFRARAGPGRTDGRGTLPGRPTGLVGRATASASLPYRALLVAVRILGRGVLLLRPRLLGADNLPRTEDGHPAGGWIAAGLPHRTWVDPFLVADLLAREPRLVFFGDGRAIFRSRLRRAAVERIGGVIPIWPGGGRAAVEAHLEAVQTALGAGAVVVVFPEVGPPVPPGEARPLGAGVAYFALRTGAPIVPLVIGGGNELYLGRRLLLVALPAVSALELAGIDPTSGPPPPWSAEERAAVARIVATLHERCAPVVAGVHRVTRDRPGARRMGRRLTTLFR
jgi:1-acyl-sn-glycerol-3-phosphate acyltransferase